jgi:phosphoenolpyruvate synthase/pyruvate phosphate dikinase
MSGDKLILPLAAIRPDEVTLAGGKGCVLARLTREGIAVPFTLVVTTAAYRAFVAANGLQEKILLELNRKAFQDMRWEELWDAALRIRSMVLTGPLPAELDRQLQAVLDDSFAERPAVVRSSAPQEDSGGASFAGIHESYVNVRGGTRLSIMSAGCGLPCGPTARCSAGRNWVLRRKRASWRCSSRS